MKIQIDAAGRIVLPKPVRTRFGLSAGVEIDLEETSDAIVLRLPGAAPALAFEDGMLVCTGELTADFDTSRILEEDDAIRAQRVWAGK